MTHKERIFCAHLLQLAASSFSNHCCNDLPEEIYEGWTEEEKLELSLFYHTENGDPEEAGYPISEDWIAMLAMAYKLEQNL